MANYVATKLSRLIKERAYRSGDLNSLQNETDELSAQLKKKRGTIRQQAKAIAKLDEQIEKLSAIDPNDIRAIRATPRRLTPPQGTSRRELIDFLKKQDGPVRMDAIVNHTVKHFDMPMAPPDERLRTFQRVGRPLNVFKPKGAVKRLPSCPETGQGIWM